MGCGSSGARQRVWTARGQLTRRAQTQCPGTQKRGHLAVTPLSQCMSGGVLLSHNLSVAVPSALKGLTSGFGMGPGVSLSLWPP